MKSSLKYAVINVINDLVSGMPQAAPKCRVEDHLAKVLRTDPGLREILWKAVRAAEIEWQCQQKGLHIKLTQRETGA